jgi:hypothetical protein
MIGHHCHPADAQPAGHAVDHPADGNADGHRCQRCRPQFADPQGIENLGYIQDAHFQDHWECQIPNALVQAATGQVAVR